MAASLRYGVLHHPVHGQDHHRVSPTQPGLKRAQRPRHQEQRGPRKDQEKNQRAKSSKRKRQKRHGQKGETAAKS